MFEGSEKIAFTTAMEYQVVVALIEESLAFLGRTSIDPSGRISISGARYSGFGYITNIDGFLRERDGNYMLDLNWQVQPDIFSWIIAFCFFPVGLLIFLLPYLANTNLERRAQSALDDIRFRLNPGV